MTNQQRIWRWLRDNPGSHVRDIPAKLAISRESMCHQLQAMFRAGCLKREGRTWNVRYWATNLEPVDLRGMHPNSARNLAIGSALPKDTTKARAALMAKGFRRRRKDVRLVASKSLHAGIPAIEQCWARP